MDFISIALQCSFLPVMLSPASDVDMGTPGFIVQPGQGDTTKSGDRVTIDFWIQDQNGKEIANSERRGTGHTFDAFATPGDRLLNAAAIGSRPGEERLLIMEAEQWYPDYGPFSLLREPGLLVVRVRVQRIDRR